jgi:primosomal protein N' (replication factor Y)
MKYYEVTLLKSPLQNLTYCCSKELTQGQRVFVALRNRKNLSEAVIVKKVDKPTFKCVEIDEVSSLYYSSKMLEVASFIAKYYVCSLGEALSIYTPFDLNIEKEEDDTQYESDIQLSLEQEQAFDFAWANTQSLLFANTGSGKTEIYIKTIEKHLNAKKTAVLLMPEISLTPQMQKRLEKAFGSAVAIWHSKITKKKKQTIIEGVLTGKIKLIAGARSALFLPLDNLGCIIVDEEHDESYKSDSKPRYHTKDLALYMASKVSCQIILGSATPSSSSFHKIPYFRLDKTYFDTQKEIRYTNSEESLTQALLNKMEKTLQQGHQIIIFLPTRANFKYQVCTSCGKSVECPYCSVSMSLHKNAMALKCHYCGFAQRIPSSCPSCTTGIIHNLRVGTAEIEMRLKEYFHDKIIKRFDRDAVTTDKKLRDILNDFNNNKIDILVGTQMLSKGHDYHNVKLAVVLGIDSILNMNSFKARERALSLLIQIAGRSGRKGQGEVIVQTQNQDFFEHYMNDYENFLKEELVFREELYPPYVKMAKVIFAHANGLKAKQEMQNYERLLRSNENIEVVGSNECAIFKLANKYRYEIILRSALVKPLLQALHSIESPMATIDMDNVH